MMQFLKVANPTSKEGYLAEFWRKFRSALSTMEKANLNVPQQGQDEAAKVQVCPHLHHSAHHITWRVGTRICFSCLGCFLAASMLLRSLDQP
jgi:hypothetical protein